MTGKEFKKLKRVEMLEILVESDKRIEQLEKKLSEAEERLGERDLLSEEESLMSDINLEAELKREKEKTNFRRVLKSTVCTLITVAAISVLIAVTLLPVLQIYGTSMAPTMDEGNIVVSVKSDDFETGDVVAFYYNNKILVKRVIGQAGDWVDLKEDGTVYVNQQEIWEPYITEKAYGECDIELPYQVPESKIFVMGDNRDVSIDSRNTTVGCVSQEQIVGKIVFRIWPLNRMETL